MEQQAVFLRRGLIGQGAARGAHGHDHARRIGQHALQRQAFGLAQAALRTEIGKAGTHHQV